jgi:putative membrane protein
MNFTTALRLPALPMILASGQALAQQAPGPTAPPYYGYGPWHMMWGYDSGWWMFAMMLLFFLIFAAVMVVITRGAMGQGGPRGHRGAMWDRASSDARSSALQILNERFARGEIQREEYQDRKAALLGERQG